MHEIVQECEHSIENTLDFIGSGMDHVEQHFDPSVAAVSVLLMILTMVVMIAVERTLGLAKVLR